MITGGQVIDLYDDGGGVLLAAWPPFNGDTGGIFITLDSDITMDSDVTLDESGASYNVYVNNVLYSSVTGPLATISGLTEGYYNPATGIITPPGTYFVHVTAVVGGVEVARTSARKVTLQPSTTMLVTPMKRLWPFPNTGLD